MFVPKVYPVGSTVELREQIEAHGGYFTKGHKFKIIEHAGVNRMRSTLYRLEDAYGRVIPMCSQLYLNYMDTE